MNFTPNKILIIQTAFIGDAVLATSVAEELHTTFPNSKIFLLVKKGNENIFEHHPFLTIWTHDKTNKYSSLLTLLKKIRQEHFDVVINLHRYLSSHLLTILSGASFKAGFQSILKIFYTHTVPHFFKKGVHEIHRYHTLVEPLTKNNKIFLPKLYPSSQLPKNFLPTKKYVCMFPGSVWATKQLPPSKWIELIKKFPDTIDVYLCGAKSEKDLCEYIKIKSEKNNVHNIAGQHQLKEIVDIIHHSVRIYVNDSAPLHIASALHKPLSAFFCSTVTDFGFYPLSEDSQVIEVNGLECRPCGVHGYNQCPKHHFKCGLDINVNYVKIVE
ncbi:MAG: glycosyltransferase family 9 protein [Bacteroidia bacterium]|nr:glycosyltransferase family 9 protein [Bacteroidia bacterium]